MYDSLTLILCVIAILIVMPVILAMKLIFYILRKLFMSDYNKIDVKNTKFSKIYWIICLIIILILWGLVLIKLAVYAPSFLEWKPFSGEEIPPFF